MIFFTLLLFYVNGALVEDDFDSDNFENVYTVIPVLSEVKYPKMFLEDKPWHERNYWDKFQTVPFKRHIKLNETKEAFQSETTKMVFDLLKKLNLTIDNDLVPNLILLGNKFNMNMSKPKIFLKMEPVSAELVNEVSNVTTLNSKDNLDADDYKSVITETNFKSTQPVTCITIIKKENEQKSIKTTTKILIQKPAKVANKLKILKVPGIWIDGQCRCNYIFRSGSYTIYPNLYLIIFFDILSCVFGK